MKKSLLSMLALAGLAAMQTSCSDEQAIAPVADGNVTFTVSVPGSISSRAFADGTTAQGNVVYYVYDVANGSDAEPVLTGNVAMASLKGTVTLGLAAGHSYDVVFLATAAGAPYSYSTTGRDLTVNYEALVNSNEDLDAFYDVVSFKVTSAQSYEAQLTRPFAQLNIGTKDLTEYQTITGKTVTATSVTISQLYTSINLMDGIPSSPESNVVFASEALPEGETFPVTYTPAEATAAVPYTYLAMDYVLVPAKKDIVDVTMTVEDAAGVLETLEYSNIPVQANYRTNIYGALLTDQHQFNVEILPDFKTPDYNEEPVAAPVWNPEVTEPVAPVDGVYTISTPGQLNYLVQNISQTDYRKPGVTINIDTDIDFSGTEWTPIRLRANSDTGATLTFDFNGHTFTGLPAPLFNQFEGTIKNLNVSGAHITSSNNANGYYGVVAANFYGTLNNVHVANSTIDCQGTNRSVGGIAGQYSSGNATNCSVTNLVINNATDWKAGGLFGTMLNDGPANRSLTDCTATGVTITDYAGDAGGAILGRAVNINLTLTGCSATDCNPSALVGKNQGATITEN